MRKWSDISLALESMGVQVPTAHYHFLTQVVNCTSGLNGLLSQWKKMLMRTNICDSNHDHFGATGSSCCGAGLVHIPAAEWNPYLRVICGCSELQASAWDKDLPFKLIFYPEDELRCAKARNAKVGVGITCYSTRANRTVPGTCLHHLLWWSTRRIFCAEQEFMVDTAGNKMFQWSATARSLQFWWKHRHNMKYSSSLGCLPVKPVSMVQTILTW